MLKIKDNVDLKELEKFGFKEYNNEFYFNDNGLEIKQDSKKRRREITNPHHLGHNKLTYDTLYDLIQADLVEKV